jgi:hypothetical protein
MGQYWKAVNLDKKEFIHPHTLAAGLKLGEMLGSPIGDALIILTAAMPERRGGGDFDLDSNYHGPERTNQPGSAKVDDAYNAIAHRTIGRWAGNRIAMVGDYAEDSDLPARFKASTIYSKCNTEKPDGWKDVSLDVCAVIEHERGGKFSGSGWRDFTSTR